VDEAQRDKKLELIKNQARLLAQSFDSVQIFCTKFEPENEHNTAHYAHGEGNWFTRFGQVRAWLLHEENEE
jgi:hypothetical protein